MPSSENSPSIRERRESASSIDLRLASMFEKGIPIESYGGVVTGHLAKARADDEWSTRGLDAPRDSGWLGTQFPSDEMEIGGGERERRDAGIVGGEVERRVSTLHHTSSLETYYIHLVTGCTRKSSEEGTSPMYTSTHARVNRYEYSAKMSPIVLSLSKWLLSPTRLI